MARLYIIITFVSLIKPLKISLMKKFTLKNLAAAAALLFAGNAMAVDYVQISTLEELESGEYVIVGNTSSNALSNTNGGNFFSPAAVTITDGKITDPAETVVWNITKGADGNLSIENGGKYVAAPTQSKNYAHLVAQLGDYTYFEPSIVSNAFRFTSTKVTTRSFQYNANSGQERFACYTNSQKDLLLFKKAAAVSENACKTPVFSISSGSYFEEQTIEITCETEGATIYYTTDETDPTAESTAYDAANPLKMSESVVIKAIAIKEGMENSAIKTLSLTFPTVVENIAGFIAAQTDELYRISGAVSVAWGDAKNLYICDNSGSLLVYSQAGTNPMLNNGDVLTGIVGTKSMYNDAAQMVPSLIPDAVAGEAVAPSVKTLAEITTDMVHQYIQIEEVTFKAAASFNNSKASNATAIEGELEMTIRNNFLLVANLVTDKTYKVTGFVSVFQNAPQIYPTEIVENKDTAIEGVEAAAVNVTAYAGNIYVAGNGEAVEVYNIAGAKVADGVADGSAIAVNAKGVMIVKAGSTVVKTIVK